MSEVFANDYNKFDILIEVKTLCRKSKTTPWAELVENGFKVADQEWEESDKITKSSGEGHARLGLLTSYLTDSNRYFDPAIAKAILPEISGLANGLGKIVLVGYVEGSEAPNPLITTMFEFSQKSGERIKVSKSIQACFQREDELKTLEGKDPRMTTERSIPTHVLPEVVTPAWFCTLWNDLNAFKRGSGNTPKLIFAEDDRNESLRGRAFSPYTDHHYPEMNGKAHLLFRLSEHRSGELHQEFVLKTEESGRGPIFVMVCSEDNPSDESLEDCWDIMLFLREFLDKQLCSQKKETV